MHFSKISFSNNLETLKFKNFPFWANYVGASCGITEQASSLPYLNFEKLATVITDNYIAAFSWMTLLILHLSFPPGLISRN